MPVFAVPGQSGSKVTFESRYDNWIGGEYVAAGQGPVLREPVARSPARRSARSPASTAEDIELALDAAHGAAPAWGRTSVAERANILNKIADRIEANLEMLAVAETWDNGKPIRETLAADMPLAVDHFRYFAGAIRAQEGSLSADRRRHRRLPLPRAARRRRPDHPVELPDPDGDLEARARAGRRQRRRPQAGRADAGVDHAADGADRATCSRRASLNVVNGFGVEAGKPLASSSRIRKIAFTGETTTGRLIMQYASQNLIPVTLELGGKSPNIFFEDVAERRRRLLRQGARGLHDVRAQPGRGLHLPDPRAHPAVHLRRVPRSTAIARTKAIVQGNPLDTDTMIGAQASNDQLEKILSYIDIGKQEGAKVLIGGERVDLGGDLSGGYYVAADDLRGQQQHADLPGGDLRPGRLGHAASTTSTTRSKIANDTLYGLGAGVWSRDANTAYRAGAGDPGRPGLDELLPPYPAHAAFGGYKSSGIGRENHAMMLDHYQQTKNLLVSYSPKKLGFF